MRENVLMPLYDVQDKSRYRAMVRLDIFFFSVGVRNLFNNDNNRLVSFGLRVCLNFITSTVEHSFNYFRERRNDSL